MPWESGRLSPRPPPEIPSGISWVFPRLSLPCFLLALLCACAEAPPQPGSTIAPGHSGVVLNVPYQHQATEFECGLAAAGMVTAYYGAPLKDNTRKQLETIALTRGGIEGADLKSAFQKTGFYSVVFTGSLDRSVTGLYHELDNGRPLIVMYMFKGTTIGHYVVVYGYDATLQRVFVLDPATGDVAEPADRFRRLWAMSGNFALLAVPNGNPQANDKAALKIKTQI